MPEQIDEAKDTSAGLRYIEQLLRIAVACAMLLTTIGGLVFAGMMYAIKLSDKVDSYHLYEVDIHKKQQDQLDAHTNLLNLHTDQIRTGNEAIVRVGDNVNKLLVNDAAVKKALLR